jgi:hypothetical protein
MTTHPAVQNAAMALLCGWDPLVYLRASGVERLVADKVLETANRYRIEELETQAKLIAHHLARVFAG